MDITGDTSAGTVDGFYTGQILASVRSPISVSREAESYNLSSSPMSVTEAPPKEYQAGHSYEDSFNHGPFGPSMPYTQSAHRRVTRAGDSIRVNAPLFGDASGTTVTSRLDNASTVLHRTGKKNGETSGASSGTFDVPADDGEYRLTAEATRGGAYDTSTMVATPHSREGRSR